MLNNIVIHLLNKYLDKYVSNLNDENLKIGILNGYVELCNLELKPEALFQLNLPIEVKAGCIGKILLKIPWNNLYDQPMVIHVEELYVVAGPIADRNYDPELERKLLRASKKLKLQQLEENGSSHIGFNEDFTPKFLEKLCTTAMNNIQVYVSNIHICYEDVVSDTKPFVCGLVLHNISAETTNHKWRTSEVDANAASVFKLIKIESFSVYWNHLENASSLAKNHVNGHTWKNIMKNGLETFSINGEDFDFIIKPVSAKVKIILNKSSEAKVPRLLLDFVLQDFAGQLSRKQYLGMLRVRTSWKRMSINRRFLRYRPETPVTGHATDWWHYAFFAWLEEFFRPHSWSRILKHRKRYKKYREMYRHWLHKPEDDHLKHDLLELEDVLDVTSILLAREDARHQFSKEEPSAIHKLHKSHSWWKIWKSTSKESSPPYAGYLWKLRTEADVDGIWNKLNNNEKAELFDAIGYSNNEPVPDEKPKQYIEHKLNFTFANCSLSLLNSNYEIFMLTLTQFLTSIETRPSAQAFHLSARIESFVVEGTTSQEHELVPLMSADNLSTGTTIPYVFALDFEKNPLHKNADFGITAQSEPVEIVYQEHAFSELAAFFHYPGLDTKNLMENACEELHRLRDNSNKLLDYIIDNHKKFDLALDMKSPYLIVPEHGTIQKGGNVLVVDLGHLSVRSELQQETAGHLEDATRTELEERLYDRFHVTVSNIQVLFADSGDEWRSGGLVLESDSHLVPKHRIQAILSNSVKPEYKQLPRKKINVTVPSVKLNLSDGKVRQLFEFVQNVPLPTPKRIYGKGLDDRKELPQEFIDTTNVIVEPSVGQLQRTCQLLQAIFHDDDEGGGGLTSAHSSSSRVAASMSRRHSNDLLHSSQEHSDEENEEWARSIDLPGFDDNVSPHNTITTLFRFVIGEVVLQLARSSDHIDKPYLMLRLEKICTDLAVMEYGPALQASLGSVKLVDKLHMGMAGEYLELITCNGAGNKDTIAILYRKVRSNCPEFRSHFHNVEQSMVVTLNSLRTVFHRGAFLTLYKFIQYILERIGKKKLGSRLCAHLQKNPVHFFPTDISDPPVPPGATKCSISFRVDEVRVRLSDSDMDLTEAKIAGFETDFVLKANEKMTLRTSLTHVTVEDLSDMTLYTKILTIADDKLFELKYVRHSNRSPSHKNRDLVMEESSSGAKCDASVRLRIGRLQLCFLNKFNSDLQRFFEPFGTLTYPEFLGCVVKTSEKIFQKHVATMSRCGMRVSISVDVHAPIVFVPQKSDSPNLLIFRMGDLSLENFFKEVKVTNGSTRMLVTDNVLVRLSAVQMTRAVITLDGNIEELESIVEPLRLRLDVKRAVPPFHRELLVYDIRGNVDTVKINVAQRDLGLLMSICKENFVEGQFLERPHGLNDILGSRGACTAAACTYSPDDTSPSPVADDSVGRRLQAFFNTSVDVCKETNFAFALEGARLTLFYDSDEALSSSSRRQTYGISCLKMDEASLTLEMFSDRSLEVKCALQSLCLEDIRHDSCLAVKTIFQSYSGDNRVDMGVSISVSMPPMIDVTYKQTQSGDVAVDILIEKTRLNVSVPYVLSLVNFLYGAWPSERTVDGGIVNHGFTGEVSSRGKSLVAVEAVADSEKQQQQHHRHASSSESTSGYYSTSSTAVAADASSVVVTMKLKKPEMVLFADATDKNSAVLVLKADVYFDYHHHHSNGQNHLSTTVAGLQLLSCVYGKRKQTAYMVLKPCDAEFTRTIVQEHDCNVKVSVSDIDFRLSTGTVHTLRDVVRELGDSIKGNQEHDEHHPTTNSVMMELEEEGRGHRQQHDLWDIKKIMPQDLLRTYQDDECPMTSKPSSSSSSLKEKLQLNIPTIQVACELEEEGQHVPVILSNLSFRATAQNWSTQLSFKGELQVELSYYNKALASWEPIVEPLLQSEDVCRPWEITIKIFQQASRPIINNFGDDVLLVPDAVCGPYSGGGRGVEESSESSSSEDGDDDDSDNDRQMTIIRKPTTPKPKRIHAQKSYDTNCLVGFPTDSDSDTEDVVLDKITTAFGHMFSSSESSEDDQSSQTDKEEEEEEGQERKLQAGSKEDAGGGGGGDDDDTSNEAETEVGSVVSPTGEKPIFLTSEGMENDCDDPGIDQDYFDLKFNSSMSATYVVIESSDKLNVTVTPAAVEVLRDVTEAFTSTTVPPPPRTNSSATVNTLPGNVRLVNRIGPTSTVTLLEKSQDGDYQPVTSTSEGVEEEVAVSPAPSSSSTGVQLLLVDVSPTGSQDVQDDEDDRFSISSALTEAVSTFICDVRGPPAYEQEDEDVARFYNDITKQRLQIDVEDFDSLECFVPKRSSTRLFALRPQKNNTRYHVVVDVTMHYAHMSIQVSSPLQMVNSLAHSLHVYCDREVLEVAGASSPGVGGGGGGGRLGNPFERKLWLATVEPGGTYHVPLFVAYHCKLFVQPAQLPYGIGDAGIWWQELFTQQNRSGQVTCPSLDSSSSSDSDTTTALVIKVTCRDGVKLQSTSTSGRLLPNYVLELLPPLQIHNRLPYVLELSLEKPQVDVRLEPEERVVLDNVRHNRKAHIEVPNYLGSPWSGDVDLHEDADEQRIVRMKADLDGTGGGSVGGSEGNTRQLAVSVRTQRIPNLQVEFYSPYCIVNKTGLPLQLRGSGSGVVHECNLSEDPMLFRFKRHRRKKAKMRVYNSHWSASFSLDTVGSGGLVVCLDKERDKKHQFMMQVRMMSRTTTKEVVILPYFVVSNDTRKHLRFMEQNDKADLWVDVAPGHSVNFWPDTESLRMQVKFRDSNVVSQPFPIGKQHDTVLRMDHGSALCVTARGGSQSSMTITFSPFVHGSAPVRVENCCEDVFLKIHQKSMNQVALLSPYHYVLYTWDDPTKERTLIWNLYNRTKPGFPAFIWKDTWGHEVLSFHTMRSSTGGSGGHHHNNNVAPATIQSSSDEDTDDDSDVVETGAGALPKKTRKDTVDVYWVSFLEGCQRVLLFTQDQRMAKRARKPILGSRSRLECCLSLSNVSLSLVAGNYSEVAYVSLSNMPALWYVEVNERWKLLPLELSSWLEDNWKNEQHKTEIKEYVHVNFHKMQMTKPFFGHLQRVYFPAVWCQYRSSKYLSFLHFKAHHLQIDNQLSDAVYPTVLSPAPRPPFVVRKTGVRPFVEVALVQRHHVQTSIRTIKYLKVLVQEVNVRVDKGFLLSVYETLASMSIVGHRVSNETPATKEHRQKSPSGNPIMLEYVHLSPLKVNFSFSSRGNVHGSDSRSSSDVVDVFLNTVGATVNEIKDVQLRIAYFQQKSSVTTVTRLTEDVVDHYFHQVLQQFYVLCLGLEVLGNPYAVIKDFTQGLGDFYYEPFFGVIQDAEEYAESVANGLFSLLGHVVGGSSTSSSCCSEISEKHSLPPFLFEDDNRKRLRLQRHAHLKNTLVASTRAFPYGVSMGLSGVTIKPVIGVQQEGVEGFFKVIGKRLFSLLTISGTVDIVDVAYDGIRRATEMGEGVVMRMRLPRYVDSTLGVRPFSHVTSAGLRLLQRLRKGHYADGDIYWAHAVLRKEERCTVVLVTQRHVFELSQPRPWAEWEILWKVNVDDVTSVPVIHGKKLVLQVRQDVSFNLFPGDERFVSCDDVHILQWLQRKIEKVLITLMEDRPCPSM